MVRDRDNPTVITRVLIHLDKIVSRSRTATYLSQKMRFNSLRDQILKILYPGQTFEWDVQGVTFNLFDPRLIYRKRLLRSGHVYEESVSHLLREAANSYSAPIFIDVGAHYGYHTVFFSKLVGRRGRVIAFEPNSFAFDTLLKNLEINEIGGDETVAVKAALSDQEGLAKVIGASDGGGQTVAVHNLHDDATVQAVTLDKYCKDHAICPDIVKIDVQGSEVNVIKGMSRILKSDVSEVLCEIHQVIGNVGARKIVSLLQDVGMEIFELKDFRGAGPDLVKLSDHATDLLGQNREIMIYARRV